MALHQQSSHSREVRTDISDKDKKLVNLVLDFKDRFSQRRWIFEREWYRNVLFYVGQQWITYEDSFRRWRKRNLPSWVPMPVTNRLASTTNVIRSAVAQVTPAFVAYPTRENERSILSANAADKYLDVIIQESGFRAAKRRLASWTTLTGNGFLFSEFDTSPDTGYVFVPGEQCMYCATKFSPMDIPADMTCPVCGRQELEENPDFGENVPQGRIRTTALSPFEVYIDNNIMELQEQPAILIVLRRSIENVQQTYGKSAKEVAPDDERDTGRFYLESLSHITGTGFGMGSPIGREEAEYGPVTLYMLYVKSCKDYPDGIFIVMSGDQHILEVKEPYPFAFSHTKAKFFPLVHIRYDDVPGRFWAKTPIDDLTFKQRQRNEVESLYQTILMRCGNPIWLIPTSVHATPITGDPGIAVRYTATGGAKPERLPGVDAPATVIHFLEQIDQDFEEIANTFAVMKGKNPGSVRAASAIQMLLERGYGRYGSVFDNLEEAYEQWALQVLEIWRQKAVFPRVQAVAKAAGSWQFMEFLGSDLGEIDLRVEAGSTRPKSQAGRQLLVGQALQWGLLNPNDPEQKMKIFEELGMTSLLPGAEADIKVVAEENAKFMTWAENAVLALGNPDQPLLDEQVAQVLMACPLSLDPIMDHHPTHAAHHRRLGLTDAFRDLPKVIQKCLSDHIQMHLVMGAQQQLMGNMGSSSTAMAMTASGESSGSPGGGSEGRVQGSNTPKGGNQPNTGKGAGGAESPFGNLMKTSLQGPG